MRPGIELIARIPDVDPRRVVDLGCGTGSLTALLADRWPDASVIGIDSSEEMVARARDDHPDLDVRLGDIATWLPDGPVDIIYSNAALHWLDDHGRLFPRLRSHLAPGGVIAVQMPDNWSEPTHRIPATLLDEGYWRVEAQRALIRDRIAQPVDYRRWMDPASVDMWRTTYFQELEGEDPVWEWVTGSLLRPVLDAFDQVEADRFSAVCRRRYREAYRQQPDGVTVVPFSRFFIIAVAG
jgi:trans-aconitate 2-methyltransferase